MKEFDPAKLFYCLYFSELECNICVEYKSKKVLCELMYALHPGRGVTGKGDYSVTVVVHIPCRLQPAFALSALTLSSLTEKEAAPRDISGSSELFPTSLSSA